MDSAISPLPDQETVLIRPSRDADVDAMLAIYRNHIRRGVETGEVKADTDVEVAMLTVAGAVMARSKHDATEAAPDFAVRVVNQILDGIASP